MVFRKDVQQIKMCSGFSVVLLGRVVSRSRFVLINSVASMVEIQVTTDATLEKTIGFHLEMLNFGDKVLVVVNMVYSVS